MERRRMRAWSVLVVLLGGSHVGAQPYFAQDLGPAPLYRATPEAWLTGRVSAIACSPTDPEKYFVGGPGSGVWRRDPPATEALSRPGSRVFA